MNTKDFHISDVLSVTTGCMLSARGMGGFYDILNFVTGDDLFPHQISRALDECTPWLIKQFPQLASVDAAGINKDNPAQWIDSQEAEFGDQFSVAALPAGQHEVIDPIFMEPEVAIALIKYLENIVKKGEQAHA